MNPASLILISGSKTVHFMKQIPINLDSIDQIFHIADVHIRNYKRHDEYREVFERLYNEIDERRTSNSLIVVAGDIVHSKTDMSPELIDIVTEFLSKLADRLPTIVTPGNHDVLANNPDRLDALSPIINAMEHPNVHYVFDTCVFTVGDVAFAHMNFMDDRSEYPEASDLPDGYQKVAIFHGIVDRAVTEYGYVLQSDDVKETTFTGYDKVLLGDIHNRQQVSNSRVESMEVEESEVEKYVESGWEIK